MLNTKRTTERASAILTIVVVALSLGCGDSQSKTKAEAQLETPANTITSTFGFDKVPVGELPAGWVVETTRQDGPPATWQVIEDSASHPGNRILALTDPPAKYGSNFNLCWLKNTSFLDGEIQVRFKAEKGRVDQGGGLIWRVQDKDNYYIARFNPLEDNFRLYYVQNGSRRTLVDAKIALDPDTWHTLKITQHGNRIGGFLDGKKYIDGTDDHFPSAGGVGLWTKADAVTSFDDFSIKE